MALGIHMGLPVGAGVSPDAIMRKYESPLTLRGGEGLVGTLSYSKWRDQGNTGEKGMWFDGTDDKVQVASSIAFDGTQTLRCLAKVQTTATGFRTIIGNAKSTSQYNGTTIGFNGGKPYINIRSSFDVPDNARLNVTGDTAFNDGDLHDVLFEYDGSGLASGVTITVDGVAQSTTTGQDNLLNGSGGSAEALYIGGRPASGSTWEGALPEIELEFDGVAFGQWENTGPNDADWLDLSGNNNDGTVTGDDYAVTTPTGWRKANDVTATVDWDLGTDNRGRDCIKRSASQLGWGDVTFDTAYSEPYIVGLVAKIDTPSLGPSVAAIMDGITATERQSLYEDDDDFVMNLGSASIGDKTVDTLWHTFVLVGNGSSDQLWVDGALVVEGVAGSGDLEGLTLLADYNGTNGSIAQISDIKALVNLTDVPQAVSDMKRYLSSRMGSETI